MDGKNEFVKKKINKNIIFTILFYLIIFSTLLIGILKFNCTTDGNFNFEIKKCIDFSKHPIFVKISARAYYAKHVL